MSRPLWLTIALSILCLSASPLAAGTVLKSSAYEVAVEHDVSDDGGPVHDLQKTSKADTFTSLLMKETESANTSSPFGLVTLDGIAELDFKFVDSAGTPTTHFRQLDAEFAWKGSVDGVPGNASAFGSSVSTLSFQFAISEPTLARLWAQYDQLAAGGFQDELSTNTWSHWSITDANNPLNFWIGSGTVHSTHLDLLPGTYDVLITTGAEYGFSDDLGPLREGSEAMWFVHMNIVPLPSAAWLGLCLLGVLGAARRIRLKRG